MTRSHSHSHWHRQWDTVTVESVTVSLTVTLALGRGPAWGPCPVPVLVTGLGGFVTGTASATATGWLCTDTVNVAATISFSCTFTWWPTSTSTGTGSDPWHGKHRRNSTGRGGMGRVRSGPWAGGLIRSLLAAKQLLRQRKMVASLTRDIKRGSWYVLLTRQQNRFRRWGQEMIINVLRFLYLRLRVAIVLVRGRP